MTYLIALGLIALGGFIVWAVMSIRHSDQLHMMRLAHQEEMAAIKFERDQDVEGGA